jgi:hypothetical protein
MPQKVQFTIAFKKEAIAYMEDGHTPYNAAKHFGERENTVYDASIFYQWRKKKELIKEAGATSKRIRGGGRKPKLDELEDILADEVVNLRVDKIKVTRTFIRGRARQMAEEAGIENFKASSHWMTLFLKRNGFSLRRMTNLTTLTDDQLIQRAVDYMKYLEMRRPFLNLSKTLCMDETAVYFEDARTQTVDLQGRRHVVIKSTGFASMRVTVIAAVWADGRKAPPMIIHKGSNTNNITRQNGILTSHQTKAWVNADLLIRLVVVYVLLPVFFISLYALTFVRFILRWIDQLFPLIDVSPGKCLVWDSCRAHIAKKVKEHCRQRNIEMIVIPGGLTPYLQAGDIGIYREFKDRLSDLINQWKNSDGVEYTRGGNPKPPADHIVQTWVRDAWNGISIENIRKSVLSAGFNNDHLQWHISKHDVYGTRFLRAWENTGDETEPDSGGFEEVGQPDDIEDIDLDNDNDDDDE